MKQEIVFNLPVHDVDRARTFFTALGFSSNAQFSNEQAAFMQIVDGMHVMLSQQDFFQSLIGKPVVKASEANEVVICLNCDSREEVDSLIAIAAANGARIPHPPEDHGFMYDQGFEDLDGHLWNLVWVAARE